MPPGEFDLIARHFAPWAAAGAFNLLDDAALLVPPNGHDLVVTKDMLVESQHFLPNDAPRLIAMKALRVNLSDLAAKGAEPLGFLLGIAFDATMTDTWLAEFAAGLKADSAAYGIPLFGGDTVKTSGPLTLSITAFGSLPHGSLVRRLATQPGDHLFVTGTIGDSAIGLQMRLHPDAPWVHALSQTHRQWLADAYLLPWPRNQLALAVQRYARAAMDISDGFVGDLSKMLAGAKVTTDIAIESIPLSPAVQAAIACEPSLLDVALTGGDDYELLIAVPQNAVKEFLADILEIGVPIAQIGITKIGETPARFFDHAGSIHPFASGSYRHF